MSAASERSFGAVVRDIGGNVDRIVRAELRMAIAEAQVGLRAAGGAALVLAVAAALAILALLFLLLGGMLALAQLMPAWAAALAVGGAVAVAAAGLVVAGRARMPAGLAVEPRAPVLPKELAS